MIFHVPLEENWPGRSDRILQPTAIWSSSMQGEVAPQAVRRKIEINYINRCRWSEESNNLDNSTQANCHLRWWRPSMYCKHYYSASGTKLQSLFLPHWGFGAGWLNLDGVGIAVRSSHSRIAMILHVPLEENWPGRSDRILQPTAIWSSSIQGEVAPQAVRRKIEINYINRCRWSEESNNLDNSTQANCHLRWWRPSMYCKHCYSASGTKLQSLFLPHWGFGAGWFNLDGVFEAYLRSLHGPGNSSKRVESATASTATKDLSLVGRQLAICLGHFCFCRSLEKSSSARHIAMKVPQVPRHKSCI